MATEVDTENDFFANPECGVLAQLTQLRQVPHIQGSQKIIFSVDFSLSRTGASGLSLHEASFPLVLVHVLVRLHPTVGSGRLMASATWPKHDAVINTPYAFHRPGAITPALCIA